MKLTFYGGAEEVGRSMIVVEKNKKSICLDCGIKLGKQTEFPVVDDNEIPKDIVISHAHLDHSGYLAHVKNKNIYATKPSKDLIPILLSDYSRISHLEIDLNSIMKDFRLLNYNDPINLNGIKTELFNAGHILGSAMIKADDILYTGDFNARGTKILDPAPIVKSKTLILDSTYSGKEDIIPSLKDELNRLADIINETIDRGGIVLIPSFAVGRAQEILIALDSFIRSGKITKVPVYVDGMIKKALKVYRTNVIYARQDIQNQILMSLHDPFRSTTFKTSKHIDRLDVKKPSIVVTTSGMLTGGPIYKYLKLFAHDEESSLIFVGYQADGTPGKEVLEGTRKILLDNQMTKIKMQVHRIKISGHSDRNDLIRFVSTVKPKTILLVHGDKTKQAEFAKDLEKFEIIIPKNAETIKI